MCNLRAMHIAPSNANMKQCSLNLAQYRDTNRHNANKEDKCKQFI